MAKRLLLVGWDAADWKIIHELLDAGKLPTLRRLVEEGVSANLASLQPMLSPMLWTSIATGKRPFKHGVLGFSEVMPDGAGVRPATRFSRRAKAVWNLLSERGLRSNVVGWWPSHPAEAIHGVTVSDFFHRASGTSREQWPFPAGAVCPRELEDELRELRVHPTDLLADHILPFVPRAAEVDQDQDPRLATCAKILAECTTVNAVATCLMRRAPWDFTAVYFDAIDHFCHAFMPYRAPRQRHIRESDFELYREVVDSAYRYHDMMLHALLTAAGPDTTVLLVSDHGFHSDARRGEAFPDEPAGPAFEHRRHGVFVAHGPNIRRDELRFGLSLLDIAPTVLAHFGLPVGDDMDGRPALEIFTKPPSVERIATWESGDREQDEEGIESGAAAMAVMEQLIDLGYVERPSDDRAEAVAAVRREHDYNLARSLMDDGRLEAASEVLVRLREAWPGEHRFGVQLAYCYLGLGRSEALEQLVEQLAAERQDEAGQAQAGLRELAKEIEAAQAAGAGNEPTQLTAEQREELRRLRSRSWFQLPTADFLRGCVALSKNDVDRAVQLFEAAASNGQSHEAMQLRVGEAFLSAKRFDKAEAVYQRLLNTTPDHPAASLGLARVRLAQRHPHRAAEHALASIGLLYHQPLAHYVLGLALLRMRKAGASLDALHTAVSQNANFPQAHRLLARIYRFVLGDPEAADRHARLERGDAAAPPRSEAGRQAVAGSADWRANTEESDPAVAPAASREPPAPPAGSGKRVVIVSGLPRSGTSLVMMMLRAGGLPTLTDEVREADESNPLGYFELERVKSLARGAAWLGEARGKAVKIVTPLIPYVPADLPIDVLAIVRDAREVAASQQAMLARLGRPRSTLDEAQLASVLSKQSSRVLHELRARPAARLLELRHANLIASPHVAARAIVEFLGVALDVEAMVGVVDPSLHRVRR